MRYLYFAVVFYVVVYSLSLAGALLLRLHDAFRSRRRGGAPRPVALRLVSPAATYTTKLTPRSAGFTNLPMPPGNQPGDMATQPMRHSESSAIARGFSGGTASAGTSPGRQHGHAA